jgi:hypothetical protein
MDFEIKRIRDKILDYELEDPGTFLQFENDSEVKLLLTSVEMQEKLFVLLKDKGLGKKK